MGASTLDARDPTLLCTVLVVSTAPGMLALGFFQVTQFAFELHEPIVAFLRELPGGKRLEDGATGFNRMTAVAKAALGSEQIEIGKGFAHAFVRHPHLKLSHAWRVNYQP